MSGLIKCPMCEEQWALKGEELDDGTDAMKCPYCGKKFVYEVDHHPLVTSYRYRGRSDKQFVVSWYPRWCSICGTKLVPEEEYPRCPMCEAVVCEECEKQMKPCCGEYVRWAEETKETA